MSDTPSLEMVQSAGAILRCVRENRDLSLEDVAKVTRISKGYLAALEEDNISRLPSEVYARGFLRVYAQFLGIEEHTVLDRYPYAAPSDPQSDEPKADMNESDGAARSFADHRRWPWYLGFCIIVAAGILFLGVHHGGYQRKEATPGALPLVMNPVSSSLKMDDAHLPEKKTLEDTPREIPESQHRHPVSRVQGIVLKMKALEDGFLAVTIDDMISQHYDLKAGDVIEWKAEESFSLDLDNAGGVEAELNGKILKPFGEKGMSAHVVLKSDAETNEAAP